MKYFIGLIFCFSLCACSSKQTSSKPQLGRIVQRSVVCADPDSCKRKLIESCPEGGVLHGATRAFILEFSCK